MAKARLQILYTSCAYEVLASGWMTNCLCNGRIRGYVTNFKFRCH